jgi:hypothetical protein
MLASIRNLGLCPCPRCLIPKERLQNLGKARDRQQRLTLRRRDDAQRRSAVASARKLIYEKNYAVDSQGVERLLKAQSLVPTYVRDCRISVYRFLTADTERILGHPEPPWLLSAPYACCRSIA